MTIDQVKKLFDFISNNYEKSGNVNGLEFTMLFNVAQTNYYDLLLGHVEQYQPGRPVPRIGMNMTESISTKLSPFIKNTDGQSVTAGRASKPDGFGRLIAMRTTADAQIDRVEHDKIAGRIASAVIPASTNPFYAEYATDWKVWPATLTGINIDWYPAKPDDVNWAYVDTSGREVYTSTGSVDPLWKDYDVMAIVARMCQMSGIAVDDMAVSQYSQKVIQTGE